MEEQSKTKRGPKCGYCSNHGIKNPLRAHKRDCKFLDCMCKLCVNTRLRREHMADMQYIKRNGIVELERLQNEQDAQAKKKDIYVKIFQERMTNKSKKRLMKDLENSNSGSETALLGESSSSAISPLLTDPKETDQIYKAAQILGIGLNSTLNSSLSSLGAGSSLADNSFRSEDQSNLNELNDFVDRLNNANNFKNNEHVLNTAIRILLNGVPLALINPINVADEIYTTFKQLNSTNIFR